MRANPFRTLVVIGIAPFECQYSINVKYGQRFEALAIQERSYRKVLSKSQRLLREIKPFYMYPAFFQLT